MKGVRNPKYGVLLDAVGRAPGYRGWELECACISIVKRICECAATGKGFRFR